MGGLFSRRRRLNRVSPLAEPTSNGASKAEEKNVTQGNGTGKTMVSQSDIVTKNSEFETKMEEKDVAESDEAKSNYSETVGMTGTHLGMMKTNTEERVMSETNEVSSFRSKDSFNIQNLEESRSTTDVVRHHSDQRSILSNANERNNVSSNGLQCQISSSTDVEARQFADKTEVNNCNTNEDAGSGLAANSLQGEQSLTTSQINPNEDVKRDSNPLDSKLDLGTEFTLPNSGDLGMSQNDDLVMRDLKINGSVTLVSEFEDDKGCIFNEQPREGLDADPVLRESSLSSCPEELEVDCASQGDSHSIDSQILDEVVSVVPNDECRAVFSSIMPKMSEKHVREKVASLLKTWDASGKVAEIERSVVNIQASSTDTISELALSLKGNGNLYDIDSTLSQIALAYKVYCWVTKNIQYTTSARHVTDPLEVLSTKQAVCHGYTTLFQAIATKVGLKVNRVDGNTRSLHNKTWTLDDSDCHTWNMVTIENTYFPVDCTYGSGCYTDGIFEHNFTRHYFFPTPENLIMTHWVEDEQFQLLEHPVAFTNLQNITVVNLETFAQGIMPETLSQFINLPSSPPIAKIELTMSCDSMKRLMLSTSLKKLHDDGENTSEILHTNDNSLTFIHQREQKFTVHAAVPKRGRFCLNIYTAEKGSGTRTRCLSYLLTAPDQELNDSEYFGYPKIYESSAAECGFSIEAIVKSDNYSCRVQEKLEMKLKLKQDTKLKHYICQGKLSKPTSNKLRCYTHLLTDEKNTSVIHHFTAVFPRKGWWTIFIVNGETNYILMYYQVYATSECKNTILLYPYITDVGEEFGIHPDVTDTPVTYNGTTAEIDLLFTSRQDLVITSTLEQFHEDGINSETIVHENDNPLSFIQQSEQKATVYVALPTAGTFSLDIYAARQGIDEAQTHCLTYTLTAEHESEDCNFIGYPKVYKMEAAECDFSILLKESISLNGHTCKLSEKLEMKLKAKHNTQLAHYLCRGKVLDSKASTRFRCYTNLSMDESNSDLHNFTAVFPSQGWWTIFIINKSNSYVLMRYQIYTTSERNDIIYPYITDEAKEFSISLQNENVPICYNSDQQLFTIQFTALYGLYYEANLIQIDDHGEKLHKLTTSQSYTYVSVPQKGTCTGCVYSIIPPGTWRLEILASEPQHDTITLVVSVQLLHGSDAMKNKIFPHITSKFSSLSLSPSLNIEEWVLPEIVIEREYPKNIKIPFIQTSNEVQLFILVKHDNQELPLQKVAKLQTSPQYLENNCVRHRVLDINLSERGEWKFILRGRHLDENNTISTLIEYVVKGQ